MYHCLKWCTDTNPNNHMLSNCSYVWEVHVEIKFLGEGDNLVMLVLKVEKEDCEISIHLQVLVMINLPK